jgi:hypothetical protein
MEDNSEFRIFQFNKKELVQKVCIANSKNCSNVILTILNKIKSNKSINFLKWDNALYNPTPTIIEAAQVLYAGQNVREISRSHANIKNLSDTFDAVTNAIDYAIENNKKVICFITGIPGAGKTLAGLNVVHNNQSNNELGVFLSGNGPLVKVLQEALARDHHKRTKSPLKESRREVQTFVHNIHLFLDTYYNNNKKPPDKIVIFDEAQRAWNKKQSYRKFKRDISEPELLLQIMDRQKDWSVFVGLIGNGQEINDGEGGLPEWGRTLLESFNHWDIFISPQMLKEGDYNLFESEIPKNINVKKVDELHLNIDIRSFRSEKIADWVEATLKGNSDEAKYISLKYLSEYPIFITRSFSQAKSFLKDNTRGLRKCGIIASSGARRLRPYGLDVTLDIDVPKWFLNSKYDIRSSSYLELPVTEFGIQGLELDWILMCWGADLRRKGQEWAFHRFVGTKWQNVHSSDKKQFILNKYRVLMTRAREGMVFWIPEGDPNDYTRIPEYYNSNYNYLTDCGLKVL